MTAPITPDERAAMRALTDAAFPGPWTVIEDHVRVHGVGTNPGEKEASVFEDRRVGTADARFIAAARTAVPRLLDALDTAETDLDGFANAVSQWKRRALDAEAEVARLRAATSPAWDEDTVQAEVLGIDARHHFHGTACLCGFDSHGRARSATEHITSAVLAVVRRHLPVSGESRAQVEAAALREAAAFWGENPDEVDDETPADCRNWLRARADRIEKGN